jgi:hypothetical protein
LARLPWEHSAGPDLQEKQTHSDSLELEDSMPKMKKALITGCTGQDGSYLSEFLLANGYEVHGLRRRASGFNTERIDHV